MPHTYPLDDDPCGTTEPNPYMNVPPDTYFPDPPKCVVFGPKFCLTKELTLSVREKVRMNRDNCFKVYDLNNEEFFKISSPLNSMRGKHVISDVNGEELAKMKKKLLSLHPTWHLNSGPKLESRLATLVFDLTLLKKKARCYIYSQPYPHEDDDTKYEHLRPSLIIKSDVSGRDFKIFDEVTNEMWGSVVRKTHGNSEMLVETDNYSVTVHAGVDVLFILSLAMMYTYALDDIEH